MNPAAPPHDDLTGEIRDYWTRRAPDFGRLRRLELGGDKAALWEAEILPHLPAAEDGKALRILDAGTGAGFFAVLLARRGHEVVGIDNSAAMLEEAEALAREAGCRARFLLMDAARPDFPDGSFDVVISRNLTWTLPDPEAAYAQWRRVLRPGGVLLNFDADYGLSDFHTVGQSAGAHAHAGIDPALLRKGEAIRRRLPASDWRRPAWDLAALRRVGFSAWYCDTTISARVYAQRDACCNPVPMFALRATR